MSQLLRIQWQKIGAVFASSEDARSDKNLLFSSALRDATQQSNSSALENGILLEPIYCTWDSDAFILEVCKSVTSKADYDNSKTFSTLEAHAASVEAGWTYLGIIVVDE
jgi:hypothetical protein